MTHTPSMDAWTEIELNQLSTMAASLGPLLYGVTADAMMALGGEDFTPRRRFDVASALLMCLIGGFIDDLAKALAPDQFDAVAGLFVADLTPWLGLDTIEQGIVIGAGDFLTPELVAQGKTESGQAISRSLDAMLNRMYGEMDVCLNTRPRDVLQNEEAAALGLLAGLVVKLGERFNLGGEPDHMRRWMEVLVRAAANAGMAKAAA